ncbi:MAG: hypothetical protein WCK02_17430 [Bacteroidota bacterium]
MKNLFYCLVGVLFFSSCSSVDLNKDEAVKKFLSKKCIISDCEIYFNEDGTFVGKSRMPKDPTQIYYGTYSLGKCNSCEDGKSSNAYRNITLIFLNGGWVTDDYNNGNNNVVCNGRNWSGYLIHSESDGWKIFFENNNYEREKGSLMIDENGNRKYGGEKYCPGEKLEDRKSDDIPKFDKTFLNQQQIKQTSQNQPVSNQSNKEITKEETKPNLKSIIEQVYSSMQNSTFDANQYFVDNIDRFISMKNTSPAKINTYINNSFYKEFQNPSYIIEENGYSEEKIETGEYKITFIEKLNCFRISKQKNQILRTKIEVIFNTNNKIRYWKHLQILQNDYL